MNSYDCYVHGNTLRDRGAFQEALEYYHKSHELMPHFKTLLCLAKLYRQLGDEESYKKFIIESYSIHPKSNEASCLYAELLIDKREFVSAKLLLNEIVSRSETYKHAVDLLKYIESKNG